MAILIDEKTRILVQGITGKEGQRAAKVMLEYGSKVVAGVTPGKGGGSIEGVPVFNSIKEALHLHPEINSTLIVVPPAFAKGAAFEAIENKIPLINMLTEGVPVKDAAEIVHACKKSHLRFVGPSSIGILSPGKCRLGVVGGEKEVIDKIYKQGNVGVISKSGGMTNETAWVVRQAGLGHSTVVGIGGDIITGSSFTDLLELFEHDPQTKGVVMFGELGGTYEDQVAEMLKRKKFTKPLAVFIAGMFAEKMPQGISFGHAGALIEGSRGLPSHKIKMLREAGALIASRHDELGEIIKGAL
ncbi:MAG: CoA-binding protein [Nanoarchaeota archaeon]|mgnify:CR=1 FL=1